LCQLISALLPGERDGGLVKLLDFLPSPSLRFIPRNSLSRRLFLPEKYSANEGETDARRGNRGDSGLAIS
jgi:hypothetical protein